MKEIEKKERNKSKTTSKIHFEIPAKYFFFTINYSLRK